MEGFYIYEHENTETMAKMVIAASCNVTKETATKMMTYCSWRITEKNGVYTSEEWLGNGEIMTSKFELGKEFTVNSSERGEFATGVATKNGIGSYLMIYKDNSNGVVSEAQIKVDEYGIVGTWSIPTTGESSKFKYKRVGDCTGTWKQVSKSDEYDNLIQKFGFSKLEVMQIQEAFHSYTCKQVGLGAWTLGDTTGQGTNFKFGEEYIYEFAGKRSINVATHTRDGWMNACMMGGKVLVSKVKVGKNFSVEEISLEGVPGFGTSVFMRI